MRELVLPISVPFLSAIGASIQFLALTPDTVEKAPMDRIAR